MSNDRKCNMFSMDISIGTILYELREVRSSSEKHCTVTQYLKTEKRIIAINR